MYVSIMHTRGLCWAVHARLGCVLHSSKFDPRRLIFPGPLTSYHLTHPTKMPSLSTVKASSIKVLFKDFGLGEVFAVRSKRNRRTQCSSTSHHEGHGSISADIPMHSGSLARDPGLQVSIDISSATASHGDSFPRAASDGAQTFLPVFQVIAGAIPIAGPPMQAAIGGLLSILQMIDRRSQNKADLNRLKERLQRLGSHLCNAPTAQNPSEQDRRNSIIRILQETSAQLTKLQKRRPEHASVTQAITGCSIEIDRYLLESLWSFQMESHYDTHQGSAILRRQQDSAGPTAMQLTAAVTLGCVKLVDATGYEHAISVTCCTSFQQLDKMLQVLFECKSIEARIQRQYMEQGQYDLCIDDDKQVTRLTSHEWPRIEAGTTIVMRIVFEEEMKFQAEYQCYLCGAVNRIDAKHSLQRQAGCSINCRICKRRFQISHEYNSKPKTQSSINHTEAETHLIRNFHVQETRNNSNPNPHATGALAASRSQICVFWSFDLLPRR
ncbi:hypothetical protein BDR06DRAFT_1020422 [Suillus hirtellus]|nr:hypothetical protein BDR06DRAFT_1020422 [Suillus hirtellus]